ncbi:MAG: hypothetical protein K2P35_14960, partial [Lachnospiraceae bacterium]|nr:hypothetical protein [Lachnospiraceae bacterium]
NWINGYDSNIDRMVDKMENVRNILAFSLNDFDSGDFDDLIKQMKKRGWKYQQTLVLRPASS